METQELLTREQLRERMQHLGRGAQARASRELGMASTVISELVVGQRPTSGRLYRELVEWVERQEA